MKTKLLCVLSFIVCVSGEANLDWWKNGVFYQIYPLSFKDGDNNGKGDLRGIISKLEHLQDAGVTGTWLSPIYKSPQVDNGYDISDYKEIDEMYGTMEDCDELIRKAHELGIKLIMDFVPNHSSDEHEWFKKSVEGVEPYKDYYIWVDTKSDTTPPNNWLSVFHGSAWTYNENRKQWYLHQFAPQQPDVNFRNPAVKKEFLDIMKFWLDKGVDGFRIDSVPYFLEDKDLRDEGPSGDPNAKPEEHESLNHIYTKDLQESNDLIYEWRDFIDKYNAERPNEDPRILMTEGYTDLEHTMLYYGKGDKDGAHIPFNFFLVSLKSDATAADFQREINAWMENMPSEKVANWVIGNHDNPRVATRFGPANVDGIHMLIGSLPGVMVTYNGEEIGLEDGWVSPDDCVDPRGCKAKESMEDYNKTSRDFCRTPFHWDDTVNAGFNEGSQTWLPVSEKYKTNNLKAQKEAGSQSHFGVYRDIVQLRKKEAFVTGDFKLDVPSENVLRVTRSISDTKFYVTLINLGNKQAVISDPTLFENYSKELKVEITSSNSRKRNLVLPSRNLILEPHEAIIASSYDATWWKHSVVYQVYPRSFKDSNNDGVGDLRGIIDKLEHFKELGIDAFWLSPIYKSPQVDQGYDISSFTEIHYEYGTMDDFDELVEKAEKLGIRVIMDFVPNHSSDQHDWFIGSKTGDERYKDFYVWVDGTENEPPNNWISLFRGSPWTWNKERQQYYLHQFAAAQPDLNYRNPKVLEEMQKVLKFWLDKKVSGFRMDAVPYLVEDSFDDEPVANIPTATPEKYEYLKHIHTSDTQETYDVIYKLRKYIDEYSKTNGVYERVMMTEAYTDLFKTMYYYGNKEETGAHFTFNFQLIEKVNRTSTASDFVIAIKDWLNVMPQQYTPNWVMGNHDKHRIATRFGVDNVDGFNMLGGILPGVMVTYNGEEIGQENGNVTKEQGKDPSAIYLNESEFQSVSRDFERTPYQWDDTVNAGFNTGKEPWLPVSKNYLTNNLKAQRGVPSSHYEIYKQIIQFRKEQAFVEGKTLVDALTKDVLVVVRELDVNDTYALLFNIGNNNQTFNLHTLYPDLAKGLFVVIPSGNSARSKGDYITSTNVTLSPHESLIVVTTDSTSSAGTIYTMHILLLTTAVSLFAKFF